MTMKPKAKRFRLRISADQAGLSVPGAGPRPEQARPAAPASTARDQTPAPSPPRTPPAAPNADAPARPPAPESPAPQGAAEKRPEPGRTTDTQPAPTQPASAKVEAKLRQALGGRAAPAGQTATTARDGAAAPSDRPAPPPATRQNSDTQAAAEIEAELAAIRAEDLTGRQLRMAMRVAQKHGIKAASGLEAVRLLRRRGIDPFEHSTLLDIVRNGAEPGRALATVDQPPLPKAYRQPGTPGPAGTPPGLSPAARAEEVAHIQAQIVQRRRRRLALLGTRLLVFVTLPTLLAAWYFYWIATPLYATQSEFVIQQADSAPASGMGGLGGLFSGTGLATSQDSVTVQSYLQSREAMRRLDRDHDFKAHFQAPDIDPLRRLASDVSDEAAYRLYRRMVQIAYDPTEGIIKLEVIAATPETSERFARALIQYAEEQVDQLTQRLRENQMRDAMESFERAEARMRDAQMQVLEMQERFQVLSSEIEVTLLTQQITTLEGQLNQERLSLQDLLANPRPNIARVDQVERRISALQSQISTLRASLTQGNDTAGGASLARVSRELVMAESDVATRQLLLAQAMQQLEAARIEANRQVRYLSMGVSPVAPDEATYPRRFENTALAFLIFAGAYLMISMTASILREQVTS